MTPAAVGLRCPEHSGKPQGVQRVARSAQRTATGFGARRVNGVTLTLIAINIGVYLAELALGGSTDGQSNWIYDHGVLVSSAQYELGGSLVGVAHGEWWRLVTAAFLHYGPFHLLINMYSLYFAGSLLEQVIGRWRFLLLYLASGIAGSAGALWLSPNGLTVGASGAIFGILGALFVLERSRHIATGGQVAMLIVLNLVFTFAVSGISVGGHIGGLIAGVALMYALLNLRRSAVYSAVAGAAVIAISFAIGLWRARVGA
jgi:membrane associated rhomboid family serine protease